MGMASPEKGRLPANDKNRWQKDWELGVIEASGSLRSKRRSNGENEVIPNLSDRNWRFKFVSIISYSLPLRLPLQGCVHDISFATVAAMISMRNGVYGQM